MHEIFVVYGLLVSLSYAAGYLPVRLLAKHLPVTCRAALLPLMGAGLISFTVFIVHLFVPLAGNRVLVGMLPVVAGAIALVHHFIHHVRPRRQHRIYLLFAAYCAIALAITAIPFAVLQRATSFGMVSNDAFWWTASDWRVQKYDWPTPRDLILSPLAKVTHDYSRCGIDYLSVLIQKLTAYRSWQTIHITGGFGLFLLSQAVWLLARRLRVWWIMALMAGLYVVMNHFVYRSYMDALLAYQFGLAYLVTLFALAVDVVPESHRSLRRGILMGVIGAFLGVFYPELLVTGVVICIVLLAALLLTQRLRRQKIGVFVLGGMTCTALIVPVLIGLPLHLERLGRLVPEEEYYRATEPGRSILHFLGAMDLHHYLLGGSVNAIQWIGAASVAALLVHLATRLREARGLVTNLLPPVIVLAGVFVSFASRGLEYGAHRAIVTMTPFLVTLLFGVIGRRGVAGKSPLWAGVACAACLCAIYPIIHMVDFTRSRFLRVTDAEKEIGDSLLKHVNARSTVMIDAEETLEFFWGHYMYWETFNAFDADEGRIVYPALGYSFIIGRPDDQLDLSKVDYVLRRRGGGRAQGRFRTVAQNDRYELLATDRPGALVMLAYDSGFHTFENDGRKQWRWLQREGRLVAVSGAEQTLRLRGELDINPEIRSSTLTVAVNGTPAGEIAVHGRTSFDIGVLLRRGANVITMRSSTPPAPPPGGGDRRLLSVSVISHSTTLTNPTALPQLLAP